MITEQNQMLSTAHRVLDGQKRIIKSSSGRNKTIYQLDDCRENILYGATHWNHPCSVWARTSSSNYQWLVDLTQCLLDEYSYRYSRIHAGQRILDQLRNQPRNIKDDGLTTFVQAMPDVYKDKDVVVAYRRYYLGDKRHLFCWKGRNPPEWCDDI